MKNTKFNWKCIHCGKRNIDPIAFQFDIPNSYTTQWACGKCGQQTKVLFEFITHYPRKYTVKELK